MSLIHADARQIPLADGCVQCVVTSPPYFGLRDYGTANQIGLEPTPDAYVQKLVAVFREVRRVLKDDGVLWLNLGDSYAWAANSGGVNRNDGGPAVRVRGLTTKPGKPKDLLGIPWRVAFALQADGWYLRSDVIWHKPNPMPESVTDRPTKAHEYLFLLAKSERYYYDAAAIRESATKIGTVGHLAGGGGKRAGSREGLRRDEWIARKRVQDPAFQPPTESGVSSDSLSSRNRRSVWTVPTMPYSGAHFATMPEKLVEPCILAGSRLGDRVLDPFIGSGTVGAVAERLGRRWVGLDLNPGYHQLAKKRTAQRGLAFTEGVA